MKKRASKPEEGAVRGRARRHRAVQFQCRPPHDPDRPLAFSAFVAVVAFLVVLGIGALVAGGFTVWGLAAAFLVAWVATMAGAHRHGNGRKWWCSASASSPA